MLGAITRQAFKSLMISIIIPVYNKAKELHQTVEKVTETMLKHGLEYEVIIINDGSIDNTYEKALSLAQQKHDIKILSYQINKGKGYALQYGFKSARGDLIVFQDADLDLPPFQIIRFLEYMEKENADVVIGNKWHPLSRVNMPRKRIFLSKSYSLFVKLLFGLRARETQVGLKLFKREVLDKIMPTLVVKKYAFDVELLVSAHQLGYNIVESPVELDYQNDSRITLKDILNIFIDTLGVFYRLRIRIKRRGVE